jgi:hypothetical protein
MSEEEAKGEMSAYLQSAEKEGSVRSMPQHAIRTVSGPLLPGLSLLLGTSHASCARARTARAETDSERADAASRLWAAASVAETSRPVPSARPYTPRPRLSRPSRRPPLVGSAEVRLG